MSQPPTPAGPPPPLPAAGPPLALVISAGLHGAMLLARGRPMGLALMESTPAGALRSFWAAALCLPAFLALRLIGWATGGVPAGGFGRALTAELIGFSLTWVGYALASRPMALAAGRGAQWPRFLAAWNWANVVQYVIVVALALLPALGVPGAIADGLGIAALGYAMWLEWFVTRLALGLPPGRAIMFVLLDVMLGIFLTGLVTRLSDG